MTDRTGPFKKSHLVDPLADGNSNQSANTRQPRPGEAGTAIIVDETGFENTRTVELADTTMEQFLESPTDVMARPVIISKASTERQVLVVTSDAKHLDYVKSILGELDVVYAETGADALSRCELHRFDVVLSDLKLADSDAMTLFGRLRRTQPNAHFMLWALYDDMPGIIRHPRAAEVFRVLPRQGRSDTLKRAVLQAIEARQDERGHPSSTGVSGWRVARERLLETALELARISGAVIRRLPNDPELYQLQLVVPRSKDYDAAVDRLGLRWAAIKSVGQRIPFSQRHHPVFQTLDTLTKEQSAFANEVAASGEYIYLLLLPWTKDEKTTVVLGITSHRKSAAFRQMLVDIHEWSSQEVSQFFVPVLRDGKHSLTPSSLPGDVPSTDSIAKKPVDYVAEYDWVITSQYVGPDRRSRPTSFFNRHVLLGKREHVPAEIRKRSDTFVDRLQKWVWVCLALYVVLSSIDTTLTWIYVRAGTVRELNPLLRPLIFDHPLAFFVVKNFLSLSSFFIVARFQLFSVGKYLIGANLLVYFALDCYWVALLLHLK